MHTVQIQTAKQVMHETLDLAGTWVDWVVFPHNSGLRRFSAFCCHYPLWPDAAPCCKFRPLTDMLANHTGVMLVSVRTIVCIYCPVSALARTQTRVCTISTTQTLQKLFGPVAQTSGGIYQAHL